MTDQISREFLKALRIEMDDALRAIARKHGIELRTGRATFTDSTFTMKVEGAIPGESKERETFRQYARIGVVPMDMLDKSLDIRGQQYTVDGMNTTGSKIIMLRGDGKRFLYERDVIVRFLIAKTVQAAS